MREHELAEDQIWHPDAQETHRFVGELSDQEEDVLTAIALVQQGHNVSCLPSPMTFIMGNGAKVVGTIVRTLAGQCHMDGSIRIILGGWNGPVFNWAVVDIAWEGAIEACVLTNPTDESVATRISKRMVITPEKDIPISASRIVHLVISALRRSARNLGKYALLKIVPGLDVTDPHAHP